MNILPRIKSYQELDGQWKIGKALKVKGDMGFLKLGINLLKNHYSAFDIAVEEDGEDASIFAERITERSGEANEYYELEITERKIVVRYTDMLSFRNAAATIIALTQSLRGEFFIRCCRLEDYADFSHRGFMLDVARQYIEPELIRERILLMAKAKYTILHLHLFDTERYALYSEAVPKLNCEPIFRQYSKAEMREIVAYAAGLGIDVIPELDFPGHGLFVLSKLPDIRCEKDGEKIGIWDMCVSNENTYSYIDLLIRELTEIFPYEYIHMGGDELSFYDMKDSGYWPNWYECDNCRCLAEKENFRSASDYYCHVVRRVYEIVKKHGRKLMIWNDSIDISVAPDLPRDILIQFWRVALDTRGPHEGCSMQRFLEEGFTVVNSFYEETYADDYMSEEALATWTPANRPPVEEKYRSQILGGEMCAWGIRNHFDYTIPANFFLFGDRLWNDEPSDVVENREMLTRQLLCEDVEMVNVFEILGGCMMPLDGLRKFCSADNATLENTDKAIEQLTRKLAEGRYDRFVLKAFITCLEDLKGELTERAAARKGA